MMAYYSEEGQKIHEDQEIAAAEVVLVVVKTSYIETEEDWGVVDQPDNHFHLMNR